MYETFIKSNIFVGKITLNQYIPIIFIDVSYLKINIIK